MVTSRAMRVARKERGTTAEEKRPKQYSSILIVEASCSSSPGFASHSRMIRSMRSVRRASSASPITIWYARRSSEDSTIRSTRSMSRRSIGASAAVLDPPSSCDPVAASYRCWCCLQYSSIAFASSVSTYSEPSSTLKSVSAPSAKTSASAYSPR